MNVLDIFSNTALISAIVAWALAQFLKIFIYWYKDKKFSFKKITAAGGMPSSHTALMAALALSVAERSGFGSVEFAIAACVMALTMYDAAGVRREAGRHASMLNTIADQMEEQTGELVSDDLKEVIGHTPFEVFGGLLVGILVALAI